MSSKGAGDNIGLCPGNSSLVLAVGLGPEINFRACLWVLIRPRHIAICWLSIQLFIFFVSFCLETLKDHWEDLGIDGWIILGRISRRWDVGIWTGLGWPRIETGGERL